MSGAVVFHGPAHHQQSENEDQNRLFLFRQVVHADNVAGYFRFGKRQAFVLAMN
jgi:hypothetical protein